MSKISALRNEGAEIMFTYIGAGEILFRNELDLRLTRRPHFSAEMLVGMTNFGSFYVFSDLRRDVGPEVKRAVAVFSPTTALDWADCTALHWRENNGRARSE